MASDLTGYKIRALRKRAGLTQAALAARAGISPSYLNLIELNRRNVAGRLLDRIAAGLGVERARLDGEAERRIVDDLNEIAVDPALTEDRPPPDGAADLVGRHPDWAALVLRLYKAYLDRSQAVMALADRLNRDPFVGESVHRMLTSVTAIRSAAEILQGGEPLSPEEFERFLAIVASDSNRLSTTAKSLVEFFESSQVRVRAATPMEHVDAFVLECRNHFPSLEDAAEAFRRETGADADPVGPARTLVERSGVPIPDLPANPESRRFQTIRLAARHFAADAVESIVEGHPALPTESSRRLAVAALHAYVAGAVLMPYESFIEAATELRCDIDALGRRFGTSYEQTAHRLATLRRPGAEGVGFAFMRSDPSGYVTKRLPLPGLPLPRYGTACPLWVIYGAFQTPGVTVRSFGELPSGERFLFFARAVEKSSPSVGMPRHLLSVMLACSADEASRVIYGDGLVRGSAMVPVGTVCRLCHRPSCAQRQEQPLLPPPDLPATRDD